MTARWLSLGAVVVLTAVRASADPTADARALDELFGKAVNAGNVKAILDCYADDASVIYPGAGDEGHGKAEIEKLANGLVGGPAKLKLTFKDNRAFAIDDTHIQNLNHWRLEGTGPDGKPMKMDGRSSELLVKGTDGTWRYLVDHASVGLPPPPKAAKRRGKRRS